MGIPDYSVCHREPEASEDSGAPVFYTVQTHAWNQEHLLTWGIAQARGSASDAGPNLKGIAFLRPMAMQALETQ